jgi:hypothetical protein
MKKVYSVFDIKAAVYHRPMFLDTHGLAIRSFEDACRAEGSPLAQHPEDYSLWYIGDFDEATGVMQSAQPNYVQLSTASAALANKGPKSIDVEKLLKEESEVKA